MKKIYSEAFRDSDFTKIRDLVLVIVLFLESKGLNAYYITKLINLLSPNIHIQILQTDLHTLP